MDIEQLEELAFANDRAQALKSLIPGTEDFYFHHSLHHQHQGELDRVDELLEAWIARHGRTGPVKEIERRQALLRYEVDSKVALEHIRQTLGLRFDHQRQAEEQTYDYPTALGQRLDNRQMLAGHALRQASDLSGFTDRALDWMISDPYVQRHLDSKRRRHLLERVQRPDYPGLLDLILADLAEQQTGGFGTLRIHGLLLPEQLAALAGKQPQLLENDQFIAIRLRQTRPSPDLDWRGDPALSRAYLDALWQLVQELSPSFNGLKALVLYHRLDHDRSQGDHDLARFLAYLRLPRRASYTPEDRYRHTDQRHLVVFGRDYRNDTGLGAVAPGDDDELVREYLMHFLAGAENTAAFDGLIRDDILRHALVEAKILSGAGDRERWYALLDDPVHYQALSERVDIEFAPTNPVHFGAGDPVSLDVYIKNVPTLVVKVFEINARNYFLATGRDIDTSVDLDGLIATHETTHTHDDPPEGRIKRTLSFAGLHEPGVYVVELVGAGKSSRALIRKGGLRLIERLSAAGHVFTILDEQNQRLTDATLLLGGREYTPREDGAIVVPYSTQPRRQTILLCHGALASVETFDHKAERYTLWTGFHVEREQLLGRQKAEVIIRPVLRLQGELMPLALLEEPILMIDAVDLQGVRTHTETPLVLAEARECVHTFQVPPDLAEIAFSLRGKVRSVSEQRDIDLSARRSFRLNHIDRTTHTQGLHLARTRSGHALYLLGKSGEVRAGQPVNVAFQHRDFTRAIEITLQTDAGGRIDLGPLHDIAHVAATAVGGVSGTWALAHDRCACSHTIHALAGEPISLPYMERSDEPGTRQRVSLLEIRHGGAGMVYVRDVSAHAAIAEGHVHLRDLEPGDYDLALLPEGERFTIRVTSGAMQAGWAAGEERLLEVRRRAPVHISRVDVGDSEIAIQLSGATRRARVHVIGTRFVSEHALDASLGGVHVPEPGWVAMARAESHYISGRDIGDEYRYILDRRQAGKFPGNMLERPSLLLNPWSIRTTSTDLQRAAEGEAYAGKAKKSARRAAPPPPPSSPQPVQQGGFANLEFLVRPAVVRVNLQPDDQGVIRLDRGELGHVQILQVLAVDDHGSAQRHIALPELDHEHRDLRLHDSMPGDGHFGEKKQISVLGTGQALVIEDIKTAAIESYDSLARIYHLFMALTESSTLSEFGFVLDWPGLDQAEKQARYSKYACHELNLFLQRKDPAFFEQVIQPYLGNKMHKTFMDHYLIGADLHGYLKPWAYGRLNAVERILLGRRIAAERGPIGRHVRELFELLPVDVERDNHLFQTALEGSALSTEDTFGFAEAQARRDESMKTATFGGGAVLAQPRFAGRFYSPDAAPPPMSAPPPAAMPAPAQGMMAPSELMLEMADDEAAELDMAAKELDLRSREEVRRLYRALDKTQEWAENNYYKRRMSEQTSELVQVNAFWRDFAEHGEGPFLSRHVAHATSSFTEMMLALAVLDLPFAPGKHEVAYADARMELAAASPSIVFHKEIKTVEPRGTSVPILVNQNYFRSDDRYEYAGNEHFDKYVNGELLVHVVYLCQVILTNPTSSQQKLDLLLQIPGGAMPVNSGFRTRSLHVSLAASGTHAIEYAFYFPAPGQYPHYPVHVTRNEALIAAAEPTTLTVVQRLSKVDTGSWAHISQHGDQQQVLDYLDGHNIARLDLERIAWRMSDDGFYRKVIELLARRHVYHPVLWSYSVLHDDPARMADYLAHENWFVQALSASFESPLVSVDPVARVWYEHLEYAPLVNARAHRLGARERILNDALEHQYRALLRQVVYQPAPGHDQRLAAAYYLFLQDRVGEALDMFDSVERKALTTALQYDYVAVFAALYRGHIDQARQIAGAYAEHPVDRWRRRFQAALAVLDEVEGEAGDAVGAEAGAAGRVVDSDDRDQVQARLAATQESFDFSIDNRTITVTYQNLDACRVSYYPMDIELLFSRQPFMQQQAERFSIIKPHRSDVVRLPAGGQHSFALPDDYQSANIIVELSARGRSTSRAYYSNELQVQLADQYGQVRVHHRTTRRPLPRTYVKVYARKQGGEVVFYKDGYTDLRGCFDYTSLSTSELDHVDRFAMLIASDEHGALIREAAPPGR